MNSHYNTEKKYHYCKMLHDTRSNKGNRRLNVDGFSYVIERATEEKIVWRCGKRPCKGRCHTNALITNLIVPPNAHTCGSQKSNAMIAAEDMFDTMCSSNLMSKPAEILTKFHGQVEQDIPLDKDSKLRSKIAYKRRKAFGLSTSNKRDDEEKITTNLKTIDGEDFVLFKSADIIIYGTLSNLERFFNNDKWMSDGTFSIAPANFQQLYVLSAKIHKLWNPYIYVLMMGRSIIDYETMWNTLIKIATENEIDVPEAPSLLVDFEKASASAFLTYFPHGDIKRCHFHMWQTLLKNMKKKGIYDIFINCKNFHRQAKLLGALAYLPSNKIEESFDKIKDDCAEEVAPFLEYFENTFIRGKIIRVAP